MLAAALAGKAVREKHMLQKSKGSRSGPSSLLTLTTLVAMLTSGCLGHHYEVPRTELERLVRTPPEQRGQNIHAVQQFTTATEPQPAEPWHPPEGPPPPGFVRGPDGIFWVPDIYLDWGMPTYRSRSITGRGGPAIHEATGVGQAATRSSSKASADAIKAVDKLLLAAVVVGVAVGVGMAASEGARFEGSVAVHPHHPVHLWYRDGTQGITALDELSAEDLTTVTHASLMGDEGAGLWERGPAPLNRKGFTYQFGAGEDHLALPGVRGPRSLGFHFGLGYFPTRQLGVLAHSRLQFNDSDARSYYNVRAGLEAQWYPLHLWRLHLGPFAGAGTSWSASGGDELPTTQANRPYLTFGGLAEFELSTRLGLTFRWTQDWLPSTHADTSRLISSWSMGLAIY
jgi:opacity protein-like surface antigen